MSQRDRSRVAAWMAAAVVVTGVAGLIADAAGAATPKTGTSYSALSEHQALSGAPGLGSDISPEDIQRDFDELARERERDFDQSQRDADRDRAREREKQQDRQMMWLQLSLAGMSVSIATVAIRQRRQAQATVPLPPPAGPQPPGGPSYPPPGWTGNPPPGPPPGPQDRLT